MEIWAYTIASVVGVSLISLIGIFTLSLNNLFLSRILLFLVSFAVGGLFGDAFIHLLPEAFKTLGINLFTSLLIITGLLLFFILEKFLRWRHCHTPSGELHPHPVIALNIIGDGVHNFLDGMIIGASYLVSIPIGIATTLAVILHEIPQEIGDFGILVHGGLSQKKALIFNFLSSATSIIGAIIALIIGSRLHYFSEILIPITAGGFIYIAGSDLIPELQKGCDMKASNIYIQFVCMICGIGIMALLTIFD